MMPSLHRVVVFFGVGVALTLAGCAKKTNVPKTVPAPPPPVHPTAAERNDAQHFLRAYDVVVESSNCQK